MKILVIPVNFNTYDSLHNYLTSFQSALSGLAQELTLDIYIADNSTEVTDINIKNYTFNSIRISQQGNLGYLGGASNIINKLVNPLDYDAVIISNVDLGVSNDFFLNLIKVLKSETAGWIAPKIWSSEEQRDRNPKIEHRYTKRRMHLLRILWKYPLLHKLYVATVYKRKKIKSIPSSIKDIYAGHGSFIILTKCYFEKNRYINYPVFLFGEEIYLAEMCRNSNIKVTYIPSLIIYDSEHISTSKMKSKFYYKCNLEAIKYCLNTFYE